MTLFIYRFIINIIFILSPIVILIRVFQNKEDIKRFKEKLCLFTKKKSKKKLIWFHGASVGEISSIIPIVQILERNKKIDQILITSTTLSSSKIINQFKFKKTVHQFFPIDTKFLSQKFIDYWKPTIAIFIDSEIWPNMILNLKKKSIPILLLNGRITKKSFERWKFFRRFAKKIFQCLDTSLSSNKETLKYLKYFGVKNIKLIGNIKFIQNKSKNLILSSNIQKLLSKKISWCASSTHRGEETICTNVHKKLKKKYKNILTVIIPRHVDRVDELIDMFGNLKLKIHCHSWEKKISKDTEIYLVDTYGETEKFFNLIKVIFIGGSFIEHGGQNPLEAARHGCNVLYGPDVGNFVNIYNFLDKISVSKQVKTGKSLYFNVENLLINKRKNKSNVKKVKSLGDKILTKTIKEIETVLEK